MINVPFELLRYNEPLNITELQFLQRKERKERRQYYKAYRLLMIMSFIIPFAAAWYRAADGAPNAFSYLKFFVSAGTLLSLSTLSTYITYHVNLRKIQLDIREQTKTIETKRITRKMYVANNNTYHFYIDSHVKLSIEVSDKDYDRMSEGDEVSIEYTTHSKQYLGYF